MLNFDCGTFCLFTHEFSIAQENKLFVSSLFWGSSELHMEFQLPQPRTGKAHIVLLHRLITYVNRAEILQIFLMSLLVIIFSRMSLRVKKVAYYSVLRLRILSIFFSCQACSCRLVKMHWCRNQDDPLRLAWAKISSYELWHEIILSMGSFQMEH